MSVKRKRELAGLTQRQLGRLSGVSRVRIAFCETGELRLSTDERVAIDKVLRSKLAQQATAISKLLNQEERETVSV